MKKNRPGVRFHRKCWIYTIYITVAAALVIASTGCAPALCREEVRGSGACDAYFEGIQFDPASGRCIQTGDSGCSMTAPFKTMEACRALCEN